MKAYVGLLTRTQNRLNLRALSVDSEIRKPNGIQAQSKKSAACCVVQTTAN